MPQHRLAKNQSEGHVIHQSLQRAGRSPGSQKVSMQPLPITTMLIPAIVPLQPKSERITGKAHTVQCNFSREARIRVRSAREPYPPFVAQGHAKRRTVVEVPRNLVSGNLQCPATGILLYFVFAHAEIKRGLSPPAEFEGFQGKFLKKGLRLAVARKPSGPDLNRQSA